MNYLVVNANSAAVIEISRRGKSVHIENDFAVVWGKSAHLTACFAPLQDKSAHSAVMHASHSGYRV